MTNEGLLSLIGTGIALGVVHVLTGPDHLSALATLSANVGHPREAAWLGIRWGLGHSSGLLLVGSILIVLSESGQDSVDMPDEAAHIFESIVGVFMLLLGTYGVRRAWLKRPKTYYNAIEAPEEGTSEHSHAHGVFRMEPPRSLEEGTNNKSMEDGKDIETRNAPDTITEEDNNKQQPQQQPETLEIYLDGDENPVCIPPQVAQDGIVAVLSDGSDFEEAVVVEQEYLQTSISPSRCRRSLQGITRRISAKTMAFGIGIVHGLAGPGGVLGVVPAVQLQNWKLACLYLSCFCVSSTLTMGCFATMYGTCSSKMVGNSGREFQIECCSALLSILVGITWLTLLAFGKLEDVFP